MKIFFAKYILVFMVVFSGAWQNNYGFAYDSKGKRDPFLPLVSADGIILPGARPVSETGNINLEGIIWDSQGKSVAIINGKLMKERDSIEDVQILKINMHNVIMQHEGKIVIIGLEKKKGDGDEEQ